VFSYLYKISASPVLKNSLFAAIEESTNMRKHEKKDFDMDFAVTLLTTLLKMKYNSTKLFENSLDFVISNSGRILKLRFDMLCTDLKVLIQSIL